MILLEGLDQRILKDRNEIIKSIKENESKHSFAYFAGWADGDGSFLKNETYVLKIQYEEPLFAFNQLYKTSILLSTPDKREWINESDPRKFVTLSSLRYNHFCENVLPFIVGLAVALLCLNATSFTCLRVCSFLTEKLFSCRDSIPGLSNFTQKCD